MEQHRFDDLTRAAARRGSRRGFLLGLIGAAVAGLGLGTLGRGAAAQDGCEGLVCPDDYCSPMMTVTGDCACYQHGVKQICRADGCYTDNDCFNGGICFSYDTCSDGFPGHCIMGCGVFNTTCDEGQSVCRGNCVDLMTSTGDCGSCGNVCGGGEIAWGTTWACIAGTCDLICRDDADYCGDDCTDFTWDSQNCGGCGNVCDSGVCCGGVCREITDAARYCDGCGMYYNFPQGCNADEVCQDGVCVGGMQTYFIASWTCDAYPSTLAEAFEPPIDAVGVKAWNLPGCQHDDGVTYLLYDADGGQVGSCVIANGACKTDVPADSIARVEAQGLPAGVTPQGDGTGIFDGFAIVINYGPQQATETQETAEPATSPTGQLVYAIRDGQHWSIWTHDLLTAENTLLADEPGSDQFAPAWSHDGTRIAYLSDQDGGVNQVWLLDAAGARRRLSDYAGTGSLVHVAWSWDDAAIVVTEAGADGSNRMLSLPADGGALTPYTDTLGGWPSFGAGERMAFVGEGDLGMPGILMQVRADLRWDVVPDSILDGDWMVGEPCLTKRGTDLALSIGQPGARRVVAFGPYSDRPVPDIPRVGSDNSNPVWSPDETQLAFVAVDAGGQSIVIHALDAPGSTPVAITLSPHDRVWYLSWNQAAEPTPLSAAGSQPIAASTETPIADTATATETPASLGEVFTSAGYGWQYTWDPATYYPPIPIGAELLDLTPMDDNANDWTFLVGSLDANNLFPIPKISIVPFTPEICAGSPAVTGGWTPVHDPLTERFFRNTDTSSFQVVHGVGPVWGAAGCSVLVPSQVAVFLHATASDAGDAEALFQRLDAIIAGFRGVSF